MNKSESVIQVRSLSKKYIIGERQQYQTFRDTVSRIFQKKSPQPTIWALKKVTFQVKRGEVLGIIGNNGAGKSTLLKILSRITDPTEGLVTIHGRVASLLEVGTGFNLELTGRENIYLNGAILGMTKREINAKFEEIVDFSGVSNFLDTPVKHYSSGMHMRLAFAVAAHLDSEILIIDEVLAVGDQEFQKKCLGKMSSVAKSGRTVIFVSHNLAAVKNLCTKALLIQSGELKAIGNPETILRMYSKEYSDKRINSLKNRTDRQGNGIIKFERVSLHQANNLHNHLINGQKTIIKIKLQSNENKIKNVVIAVGIDNIYGSRVFSMSNELIDQDLSTQVSLGTVEFVINRLPLVAGEYTITLFARSRGEICDWISRSATFTVESGDFYGSGREYKDQGDVMIEYTIN